MAGEKACHRLQTRPLSFNGIRKEGDLLYSWTSRDVFSLVSKSCFSLG